MEDELAGTTILIPKKRNHKLYKKTATFLNLSSADRKWLANQGPGYFVLRIKDVWEDKEEYRVNIEGQIMRKKSNDKKDNS